MIAFITFSITLIALIITLFVERMIYKYEIKDPYLPITISYLFVFLPYILGIIWTTIFDGRGESWQELSIWSGLCFVISYLGLTNMARHAR